ncbi:hypothetical protein HIM_11337 [Hirsutella minnesotensis 3608]|uniref:Heterokaryon incompatibility domain-containing protein n=1 Tax=Hirsutella minnesotensis 3608 TaxID=1043627 RepID=A0A0F7ZRA6_9HYPO|nr:hypothetical protein HIM_11337 [Hirsutella minnesotensis 3608]
MAELRLCSLFAKGMDFFRHIYSEGLSRLLFHSIPTVLIVDALGREDNPLRISRFRNHLPGTTHSETTIATIQSWIEECATTHEKCSRQIGHAHRPVVYPKRLLDLNEGAVILRENIQHEQYACLSHCWGANSSIVKTTTQNLDKLMTQVPWDHLTATFQDAIVICRRLGIYYLWIDSLCIIQDSDDDWKDQAAQMADIYENAFATVAVTKSRDGSEGCFAETDAKYLSKLVPGYQDIYVRQELPRFPSHWTEFDLPEQKGQWPLLNRAWVYQEMRLSSRVLHFCAEEVVLLCRTARRSESGCNDDNFVDGRNFKATQYSSIPYWTLQEKPRLLWYRTVQEYSRLQLTFESDKMAALAGLTQRLESLRSDDRYMVGLWERSLLLDLLWMVWPSPTPGRPRIARYPSWSWASVNSQVMWEHTVESTFQSVLIREIRFVSYGPACMGESSEAAISLEAPLMDASPLLATFRNRRTTRADRSTDTIAANLMQNIVGGVSRSSRQQSHIQADELFISDYKVDCITHESATSHNPSDSSGYVILLGFDTKINAIFAGIHVRRKCGSDCYERVGHVQISHQSLEQRRLDTQARTMWDYSSISVKEIIEGLPTSTIMLV